MFGVKVTDDDNNNTMFTRRYNFKGNDTERGVLHGDKEELSTYLDLYPMIMCLEG